MHPRAPTCTSPSAATEPAPLLEMSDLPVGWISQKSEGMERLYKLREVGCSRFWTSYCIVVETDRSWKLLIDNKLTNCSSLLSGIPEHLDRNTVMQLMTIIDSAFVCHGFPCKEYVDMAKARKGVLLLL